MIRRTMVYKITIAKVWVHEDSFSEGECSPYDDWQETSLKGTEYDTIMDLLRGIEQKTNIFSSDPADYVFIDGESRIDTDMTVNAQYKRPIEAELKLWKADKIVLYNAYLSCRIMAIYVAYSGDREISQNTRYIDASDIVGTGIAVEH